MQLDDSRFLRAFAPRRSQAPMTEASSGKRRESTLLDLKISNIPREFLAAEPTQRGFQTGRSSPSNVLMAALTRPSDKY